MRRKSRTSRLRGCSGLTSSASAGLVAALLVIAFPAVAQAVVVLPKGSAKPVIGYLVRQDERTVVVREPLPGNKSRELSFARSDIDELLITVSSQRLSSLDPAQPQQYREYAEELAEKVRDPEARDAALRLYAIAAARSEGKLRKSALLGLVSLARSADEERRFRAAAYVHDPDQAVLTGANHRDIPDGVSDQTKQDLLSIVRLARQGKGVAAKASLDQPAIRAEAGRLASCITLDELLEACGAKQLTDEQLQKLVRAELMLRGAVSDRADKTTALPTKWSQARRSGGLSPMRSLSLERLTEFDPALCVFRDGKWIRP
jgi:hypothetical protein